MNLQNVILHGFRLNIDYLIQLIDDVEEKDMQAQPNGFVNHPAWTVGHITTSNEIAAKVMGQPYSLSAEWDDLFKRRGPGDPRTPSLNQEAYPSKKELMSVIREQETYISKLLENVSDEELQEEHNWRFDNYMNTKGEYIHFLLLIHNSWHIGQLAEWRRMMGLDSALSQLAARSSG